MIVAEAILRRLKSNGIDHLIVNAGTDFAAIVETYARLGDSDALPKPIIAPHENAAISMAHGMYLASGKPQALMVHVSVGTANTVCGIMNAARENVPILVMAGRTPISEEFEQGHRNAFIHWGQEMFDQGSMVRELVKWDYELKLASQSEQIIDRATQVANSGPRGPVYLSLPREILAMDFDAEWSNGAPAAAPAADPEPNSAAIDKAAEMLAGAKNPLVITATAGKNHRAVPLLEQLVNAYALPMAEHKPGYLNMRTDHPMHAGFDVAPLVAAADVILVLDALVPWYPGEHDLREDVRIIHMGPDPVFPNIPVRSHRADLSITCDTASGLEALLGAMERAGTARPGSRRDQIIAGNTSRREAAHHAALVPGDGPMNTAQATSVLDALLPKGAIIVNELGVHRPLLNLTEPGSFFGPSSAGGLGWGLGAALGIKHAMPERLVVATIGDGSYIFANPLACHQIAAAENLPVLTLVFNNQRWDAVRDAAVGQYPEGATAKQAVGPLASLAPSPDFARVSEACGGWGANAETPEELAEALRTAFRKISEDKTQALVNIQIA